MIRWAEDWSAIEPRTSSGRPAGGRDSTEQSGLDFGRQAVWGIRWQREIHRANIKIRVDCWIDVENVRINISCHGKWMNIQRLALISEWQFGVVPAEIVGRKECNWPLPRSFLRPSGPNRPIARLHSNTVREPATIDWPLVKDIYSDLQTLVVD